MSQSSHIWAVDHLLYIDVSTAQQMWMLMFVWTFERLDPIQRLADPMKVSWGFVLQYPDRGSDVGLTCHVVDLSLVAISYEF